tara:strand:- start:113 stop:1405 length:1293 start_codon:yes stop_codon:yes gene_type:complete
MQNYNEIVQKKIKYKKVKKAKEISQAKQDKLKTIELKELKKEAIEEFLKKTQLIENLEKAVEWYLEQSHVDPKYRIYKYWSNDVSLEHTRYCFRLSTVHSFFDVLAQIVGLNRRYNSPLSIYINLERNFLKNNPSESIIIDYQLKDVFGSHHLEDTNNDLKNCPDNLVKTVENIFTDNIVFIKNYIGNNKKSDFEKRIQEYGKPRKKELSSLIKYLGKSLEFNGEQHKYKCGSGKEYKLSDSKLIYFFGDPEVRTARTATNGANPNQVVPLPRTIHALVKPFSESKTINLVRISMRYQNGSIRLWRWKPHFLRNPYENCNASITTLWSSNIESLCMYDIYKTSLTQYEIRSIKRKKFEDTIRTKYRKIKRYLGLMIKSLKTMMAMLKYRNIKRYLGVDDKESEDYEGNVRGIVTLIVCLLIFIFWWNGFI